jgi:hypothetical protein
LRNVYGMGIGENDSGMDKEKNRDEQPEWISREF